MAWYSGKTADLVPSGLRLAALWQRLGILRVAGAHNALAGLLARRAGFEALYISGAAVSASMGLPDLGLFDLGELCFFTRIVARATELPLIVDADTGFGGVLNVIRAVRELEDSGAAAIQIEDQMLPKKCGHLNDKRLVGAEEMAEKIRAAAGARRNLRIIARTDAAAAEGVDGAISRARLYRAAGADAIFPEALTEEAHFRRFAREIDLPLLANMTEFGRTPYFTARQFEAFGMKMVLWPVSSLRVAAKAMEELYACLAREGSAVSMLDRMQTRAELYDTLGYYDYEALDRSIARSTPPPERRRG